MTAAEATSTPGDRPTLATSAAAAPGGLAVDVRGADAEITLVPTHRGDGDSPTRLGDSLRSVVDELAARGIAAHLAADHGPVTLDERVEDTADRAGLTERRDLLVMTRPLPIPTDHPARSKSPAITVRPFHPGVDDAAWLRVNNRAFAAHPDQGHETPATLAARTSEDWFEADDFLVADDTERPGELSGFCWTKVHPPQASVHSSGAHDDGNSPGEVATDEDSGRGEIYVIGVDPSHEGHGLGRALVLAGLDHLAGRGPTTALLYVDATNEGARRLYDGLGFVVERRRRVYTEPAPS